MPMGYVEGFVLAVPTAKKEAYKAMATRAASIFKEHGVTRFVECWADDVPKGKLTDFFMAVDAREDESVLFSWLEYPSKEVRDAANEKIMADPRLMMESEANIFDGKRMILGGFMPIVDL